MATDKKISDLPVAPSINANDTSVLVKQGIDYQFAFDLLLQFISAELQVGANISFGTTIPSNNIGKNGDVFVNTVAGYFAQKTTNVWGVVYTLPQSNATADGTVLYGNNNPGNTIGHNNDTYINTVSGIFYKKIDGIWNQVFSLQSGPSGPRGNSVLSGLSDPSAPVGQNGDFYLNITTQNIFGPKSNGIWPTGISLKGANGNTILNGTLNPSNLTDGVNGDFYINTATYNIFGPKTGGVWGTGTSLISYASSVFNGEIVLIPSGTNLTGDPGYYDIDYLPYFSNHGGNPSIFVLKVINEEQNEIIYDVPVRSITPVRGQLNYLRVFPHIDPDNSTKSIDDIIILIK